MVIRMFIRMSIFTTVDLNVHLNVPILVRLGQWLDNLKMKLKLSPT